MFLKFILILFLLSPISCTVDRMIRMMDVDDDHLLSKTDLLSFYERTEQTSDSSPIGACLQETLQIYKSRFGTLDYAPLLSLLSDVSLAPFTPQQLHIMFGSGDANSDHPTGSISLVFINFQYTSDFIVQFDINPSPSSSYSSSSSLSSPSWKPFSTLTPTISTYNVSRWGWAGWIYTTTVPLFSPNSSSPISSPIPSFRYSIHSASLNLSTSPLPISSFPPNPSLPNTVLYLAGDIGTVIPLGWAVFELMANDSARSPPSVVVALGDLAYAEVNDVWGEYEPIWDLWGRIVQPLSQTFPFATVSGNHEEPFNFSSYTHRYNNMPGQWNPNPNIISEAAYSPFWYSFDDGLAHVVVIATSKSYAVSSPQYAWLQADLAAAAANRKQVPWIVVAGHAPMYTSDLFEFDQVGVGSKIQQTLESLFLKYQVDFYFSGHRMEFFYFFYYYFFIINFCYLFNN